MNERTFYATHSHGMAADGGHLRVATYLASTVFKEGISNSTAVIIVWYTHSYSIPPIHVPVQRKPRDNQIWQ